MHKVYSPLHNTSTSAPEISPLATQKTQLLHILATNKTQKKQGNCLFEKYHYYFFLQEILTLTLYIFLSIRVRLFGYFTNEQGPGPESKVLVEITRLWLSDLAFE